MQVNLEITPIIYRRKQIDAGVILGSRKFKWMLRRKYSPLSVYDFGGKCYISALSPHKRDFQVYIPASNLAVGMRVQVHDKPYKKPEVKRVLRIVKICKNDGFFGMGSFVVAEIEKEEIIEKTIEVTDTGYVPQSQDDCPFGDYVQPSTTIETLQEMPQEPFEEEEECERMHFEEESVYIDSLTAKTEEAEEQAEEPENEKPTTDTESLFVMPETQTRFQVSTREKFMQRNTFLKMAVFHADTRMRVSDHAEQTAFMLPVLPLQTKKQQIIRPKQPLLIVFEGYQYGLFGGASRHDA